MADEKKELVLIYRLGSLGDTIVALPCFHLIAKAFPSHKRVLLTNRQMGTRDMPGRAILKHTGLVDDYIEYPLGLRGPRELFRLRSVIASLKPSVLVYLTQPRGLSKLVRDFAFFSACGIRKVVGIPFRQDLRENRWLPEDKYFEPEAGRLARCLAPIGDARLDDPASWDLHLTAEERGRANQVLMELDPSQPVIACSVSAKLDVKDWGINNWQLLFSSLSRRYPRHALALLGAGDESAAAEATRQRWQGLSVNLCGALSPRESGAVLERAALFVGHDSGPMHLAASVGTPCVAIFSARNLPRVWFPYGSRHRVIYKAMSCGGCALDRCEERHKECITSISVAEVIAAIAATLPTAEPAFKKYDALGA